MRRVTLKLNNLIDRLVLYVDKNMADVAGVRLPHLRNALKGKEELPVLSIARLGKWMDGEDEEIGALESLLDCWRLDRMDADTAAATAARLQVLDEDQDEQED